MADEIQDNVHERKDSPNIEREERGDDVKGLTVGVKVAMLIMVIMFLYLFCVTFLEIPQVGNEHAKTIVPYFLGVFTTLVGVYWGTSKKDQDAPPIDRVGKTIKEEEK